MQAEDSAQPHTSSGRHIKKYVIASFLLGCLVTFFLTLVPQLTSHSLSIQLVDAIPDEDASFTTSTPVTQLTSQHYRGTNHVWYGRMSETEWQAYRNQQTKLKHSESWDIPSAKSEIMRAIGKLDQEAPTYHRHELYGGNTDIYWYPDTQLFVAIERNTRSD